MMYLIDLFLFVAIAILVTLATGWIVRFWRRMAALQLIEKGME